MEESVSGLLLVSNSVKSPNIKWRIFDICDLNIVISISIFYAFLWRKRVQTSVSTIILNHIFSNSRPMIVRPVTVPMSPPSHPTNKKTMMISNISDRKCRDSLSITLNSWIISYWDQRSKLREMKRISGKASQIIFSNKSKKNRFLFRPSPKELLIIVRKLSKLMYLAANIGNWSDSQIKG